MYFFSWVPNSETAKRQFQNNLNMLFLHDLSSDFSVWFSQLPGGVVNCDWRALLLRVRYPHGEICICEIGEELFFFYLPSVSIYSSFHYLFPKKFASMCLEVLIIARNSSTIDQLNLVLNRRSLNRWLPITYWIFYPEYIHNRQTFPLGIFQFILLTTFQHTYKQNILNTVHLKAKERKTVFCRIYDRATPSH